ncbi:homeobox-DDT domain protein RLT1 isoform X1 [Spinacia oleracea]|uniref:Homeobox-DDT domain protein RLT1 isoform X1 n=1 Tax=Spinacia oleracea TaxID=3562 RepID=A0A9R0I5Z0_SPIOL|nr:homeobox-DDT domain protein RLT1 isoform X1 [Spinacia oleracea]
MEDSIEVQCEENKEFPEKNKRRRFKTPYQLQALEDFYNEHKYPTESMKTELAENLGLTEKQISGWFCHRRLKDKRIINGELNPLGKQEISSGVIQDRGSGLKQDSCSSNKQGDYRLADLREVESRRFGHNDIPVPEINYEQRVLDDGTEIDDTSSESNSAPQGSFYPHKRSPLNVETTEYRAPNGFVAPNRRRAGPSGYLKIKGQTENVAVTAVKRQLGRQYQDDGPPLGIEFDPLPPGAFESPCKNVNTDAYGVSEHVGSSSLDVGVIHKRHSLSTIQNQDKCVAPANSRSMHKSDSDTFSYRQPKQKSHFPNHGRVLPVQKSPFGVASYSARETSDYDGSMNNGIRHKHESSGMGSDSYGGKFTNEPEDPWWHNYDNGNSVAVHRRERLDSRSVAPLVGHKDPIDTEDRDRVPPSRIMKDVELYAERRPVVEYHDFNRLKMRPNELRAGKRGREELLEEDYAAIRSSSQEPPQWSRQIRGSTEMPSSFSEDETAETSSSMD